jgi:HD-like signal output (HDOD) protein
MSAATEPKSPLDIALPALPDSLVRLSLLMAEQDVDLRAVAALVESDMALAAAVLRAVNSPIYGLSARAHSVQQALTYLGMREVAAVTYEIGLRAAFPPSAQLAPIWKRAALRGLLMGRMAQQLGIDAWAAHSAGLFEECGKAVLLRHAAEHYPAMLRATANDVELATLEFTGFGIAHDALGAALTSSWGLAEVAVESVRLHLSVRQHGVLPSEPATAEACALSATAYALMEDPESLSDRVAQLAAALGRDAARWMAVAERVRDLVQADTPA